MYGAPPVVYPMSDIPSEIINQYPVKFDEIKGILPLNEVAQEAQTEVRSYTDPLVFLPS